MARLSESEKVDVLVQLRGIRGLSLLERERSMEGDCWAVPRRHLADKVASHTRATVVGWLVSVPLVLLRCDRSESKSLLNRLRSWVELERVEEVLFEKDASCLSSVNREGLPLEIRRPGSVLRPGSSDRSRSFHGSKSPRGLPPTGSPAVGFADLGRPDLRHPELEMLMLRLSRIPLFSLHGENTISGHPTSVLASYLESLGETGPERCIFESLSPDAGPFSWLAAVDRLIQRGSRIINLSYGRLSLERKRGWAALEWGMELLCRVTGVTVVAAAGQPCEGLMEGRRLHLPASVPEVLAADGEDRWSGCSTVDEEEQEILLASRRDPLGGRSGSSFSAPRLAARATEVFSRIPTAGHHPELVRALLLAATRPNSAGFPTPGTVESARLRTISSSRSFALGERAGNVEWSSPARTPQRLAMCWREGEEGPRIPPSLHREILHLRRGGRWLIMDLSAQVQRVQVECGQRNWGMAWHPLDHHDLEALESSRPYLKHAS